MKLEVGKYYRNRIGNKCKIVKYNRSCDIVHPYAHDTGRGEGFRHWVTAGGKSCINDDNQDLVAEWVDEPVGTQSPLYSIDMQTGDVGLMIVLRDQFAIAALADSGWRRGILSIDEIAKECYTMADAMMRARGKGDSGNV